MDAILCGGGQSSDGAIGSRRALKGKTDDAIARPSADQLSWLDLEIGSFFHYTMYDSLYN